MRTALADIVQSDERRSWLHPRKQRESGDSCANRWTKHRNIGFAARIVASQDILLGFSEESFTKKFFLFVFFLTKLGWHIENKFFFLSHICRRPIGFRAFPTVSHFKLVPYVEETGSCFERPNGNQAGELSGLSSIFDASDCFAPHHNRSSRQSLLWGKPWTIHAADEHND